VRRLLLGALALTALAGCGGSGDGLAPAAEPERSPPLTSAPAGRVVAVGHRPEGLAFDPRTGLLARVAVTASGRIAVLSARQRALELFDARGRRSLGRIHVGIGPTHVVARGERLFVVDTRGDALLEVLADPLRVHRRTHVRGAPYGIAFDPVRKRFWVTLTGSNRLAELTDRRVLRTFPTVRQPNSVAVDPGSGRVFVASRRDGTLQLFDPPPYRG
jgi:DNA-binding beta-propeller fold protein YncE